MRRRWRTGPTVALFLIGVALMVAGVVVGLGDGSVPMSEQLADALPAAGLALMACAAALVATKRTPAFDEARGLAWLFLVLVFLTPLLASVVSPELLVDPLVLGIVGTSGLAVGVTIWRTPGPPRASAREFTTGFGMVLTAGIVLAALTALLVVLAASAGVLWVPAFLLGAVTAAFLAAPAALMAAGRVRAGSVGRALSTAYLVAVYLAPFVVARVLASRSFDGLAIWLLNLLMVIVVLVVGAVVVAALAYDSALGRRRPRRGAVSR